MLLSVLVLFSKIAKDPRAATTIFASSVSGLNNQEGVAPTYQSAAFDDQDISSQFIEVAVLSRISNR